MELGDVEKQNSQRDNIKSFEINFIEIITSLAHICILGYAVFLLYLCFNEEILLITWHPIFFGIGWSLLMTEGILILSPNNIFTRSLPHKTKKLLHWIIETIAVTASVVGLIIIVVNKSLHSKPHLRSWHAILGLVSMIGCAPTCVSGITVLYGASLKGYIKPVNNKFIHRICGSATFFVGLISIIFSFYTHWYKHKSHSVPVLVVLCIAIVFSYLWTLRVSFLNIYKRIEILLR